MNTSKFLFFLMFLSFFELSAQDKKRLPNPINTPASIEYAPSITADGQTLIYQSDQYGLYVNSAKKVPQINADGKTNVIVDEYETNFFGVYEVKLHPSGQWMAPKNIEAINQYANETMTPVMGGPSISYDGNTIYFFANFGKSGYGREDIYVSERNKNGWSRPENIGSTINTDNYEGFPSISPDGKKLYFTREILGKKVDDKQCYRIMVTEKGRNGKWKAPYELPAPINMDCEKAPRILADGKTLVYSSIKKGGKGDFDLYKSELQPDGSWSEPINLEFINTKKSDLFVSVSPCGDMMYYVSNGDIYTSEIPESLRPVKSATIQGFILDSISKQPVVSRIIVKDKSNGTTLSVIDNNPSDGRFTAIVPFGKSYELSVNHPDFFTKNILLESEKIVDCTPIPMNFELKKIPSNTEEKILIAQSIPQKAVEIPKTEKAVVIAEPEKKKEAIVAKPEAKPIEELELVAESQTTESVKIKAEGEKPAGTKTITTFALILRIVDKESGQYINAPKFELTQKDGSAINQKPEINGNDYIFKIEENTDFKIKINAENYLDFVANIPTLISDKRVTVKLAPKLKSYLMIAMLDFDSGEKLSGKIEIKSKTKGEAKEYTINNGSLSLELTENDFLSVKGIAPGHFDLEKSLDIALPENGGKNFELELKLTLDEYILNLSATDLETGKIIPNAVFYVNDATGKRVLELLADTEGKASGKLSKNGKYTVQCMAEGFKVSEQTVNDLLQNTQILFKSIPEKVPTHELKVQVIDRFTGEELYPNIRLNQVEIGKAPFFVKGAEKQIFEISTSGADIKPESHKIAMVDSLIKRVSSRILGQKTSYDFDFAIYDKKSQKPLSKVVFKMLEIPSKNEVSSGVPGELMASLEPGKSYSLQINAAGFEPVATKVEATDWIKQNNFERKIFMNPIESAAKESNAEAGPVIVKNTVFGDISKGKKITLENIYFDQSSPVLRKESFKQLDDLAKILSENPALSIEIRGHTDNVGDFFENVKLSKSRCESVMEYLSGKGITKNRLSVIGRGPIEPLAPNDTEENKKKNRRVEFLVL